ncbi:MAG: RimK family protein [Gemmatimonadota bacterium]|nr:RimK family protein [Gemmatimonadota bacterium]
MTAPRKPRSSVVVVTDLPAGRKLDDVQLVTADDYLAGEGQTVDEGLTIVNLCRSFQYLSRGYYVSLLGEARKHRTIPTLETIQAITDPFVYFRTLQEAGLETIEYRIARGGHRLIPRLIVPEPDPGPKAEQPPQPMMAAAGGDAVPRYERVSRTYREITSILGRTTEPEFRRIASAVFKVYPVPLLRIRLYWDPDEEEWQIGQICPVSLDTLNADETELLKSELGKDRLRRRTADTTEDRPFRIACLFDEQDPYSPTDEGTLERFERAAERRNALFEVIGREDLSRLAEYDALFIRTVTAIDHYAFTFSRVAESLDIPVIDDPRSIMRCSNKVYLHELFEKHAIPTPHTEIISRTTPSAEVAALGFPMILKVPDGTFSHAVKKATTIEEFERLSKEMFRRSPLLIAQEFTPTPFDWRIGVLDGALLFAAKYHMVKDHWQIVGRWKTGRTRYGKVEAVPFSEVPADVSRLALDSASLIGEGLYGVDLKETKAGAVVIEVNDNPNIMEGDEDAVERDGIYDAIISTLLNRIRAPRDRRTES